MRELEPALPFAQARDSIQAFRFAKAARTFDLAPETRLDSSGWARLRLKRRLPTWSAAEFRKHREPAANQGRVRHHASPREPFRAGPGVAR
jgi:hypothetical protein